ncbi:MAG TPA: winged helix-turn-helix domain-containing protein [archaeon]|nr:winged helix-turn-helix domain-containing protein [archaeon]
MSETEQQAPGQMRRASFKIVIRKVEQPFSQSPLDELNWICQSLGFMEPIDRDKTASSIFREIIKATESGEALSSSAIADRVGMSRGAIINHLNNLMRSGLITRDGRFYSARSRSIYRTIEEIEEDIERIFTKMKRTAMALDEELGIKAENSKRE